MRITGRLRFHRSLAGVLLAALTGCTGFFFQPNSIRYSQPADWNANARIVTISTPGHASRHWLFPARHPTANVFFLHGNAQNISAHARNVAWLPAKGYNVLLFEYPGYGENSKIKPSLSLIVTDIRLAIEALGAIGATKGLPTVMFGQSLGASLALYAASLPDIQSRLCAVIAESPFADYRLVARESLGQSWILKPLSLPLSWTINNDFSPIKAIDRIRIPVLLIHGRKDSIVPYHHSETLFRLARQPKHLWLYDGGHIAFLRHADGRKRFASYLTAHCAQKKRGPEGPRIVRKPESQLP